MSSRRNFFKLLTLTAGSTLLTNATENKKDTTKIIAAQKKNSVLKTKNKKELLS